MVSVIHVHGNARLWRTLGDLEVKCTSDGSKYVEFNECDTKFRSGETRYARSFEPKCGAHPKTLSGAQYWKDKATPWNVYVCMSDSPFYFAVDYTPSARLKVGQATENGIGKCMALGASLQGRKNCMDNNDNIIGRSLNSYKQPLLNQMSEGSCKHIALFPTNLYTTLYVHF